MQICTIYKRYLYIKKLNKLIKWYELSWRYGSIDRRNVIKLGYAPSIENKTIA